MTLFDQAFRIVIGEEGGLSKDPRDRGNWSSGICGVGSLIGTRYGVAAAFHPGTDIVDLSLSDAKMIHLKEYWTPAGCDLLPPRAAVVAYDCSINQGQATAIMMLQSACNIPHDGVLGQRTREVFPAVKDEHVARFMALRAVRYANTRGFPVEGEGWMDRLFTLMLAPLETT